LRIRSRATTDHKEALRLEKQDIHFTVLFNEPFRSEVA
jgi:hypothetical protein